MLKPTLQLRMGQQLTMTPQLQQAIRLLQMPALELQAHIRELLESNVMLEPVEDADTTSGFEAAEPAVAEPEVTTEPKTRRMPPYNVVILNDEEHTFPYVIEMLIKLFRHDHAKAENQDCLAS